MKFEVPKLTCENYKFWKDAILLQLEVMDVDYATRKDKPQAIEYQLLEH